MSWPRAGAALCLLLALSVSGCNAGHPPCTRDAVTARALSQLHSFGSWVTDFRVRGVIGEVGWPAGPRWQALATTWYDEAGRIGLGAFAWSGAERWPASYPLAVYRGPGLTVAGAQSRVVERQPAALREIALADGSFGAAGTGYSSLHPGVSGTDYEYPSATALANLRTRGIDGVRLALTWERVQPRLGGPLSANELGRLRRVLAQAAKSRLRVVLDLHNYGRFASPAGVLTLGSPALPATDLADLWRRLARALGSSPALSGYGLMNEPHDLPGGAPAWERASQLTVAAVRAVDRTTPILVAGYSYSSAARWPSVHPRPWINPRSGPVLYEAHQYFDRDGSGTYRDSYQAENARARGQHWQRCG